MNNSNNRIDANILRMVGRRIGNKTFFTVQYLNGEVRRYVVYNDKETA